MKTQRTQHIIADKVGVLRQMLLIRRFEEKSVELYSSGKVRGFLHLYNWRRSRRCWCDSRFGSM